MNIAVPGDASSLLRVPLSYYRADAEAGTVELWYAVVGDDTRRLSQMAPGSTSNLLGPGGRGWLVPEGTRKALLVAGGIGVPPVLCLAGMLAEQGVDVDVCLGFGTASKAVASMSSARWELRSTYAPTTARWARTASAPTCRRAARRGRLRLRRQLWSRRHDEEGRRRCRRGRRVLRGVARAHDELWLWRLQHLQCRDGRRYEGACMCGPVFDASKVVVF